MVADLFEWDWTLVDVSLVGLPKQRVERLISADTGSSDSDVKYDQPLETLQSIHRRCSIQNKWCIRKVGCNASEMRSTITTWFTQFWRWLWERRRSRYSYFSGYSYPLFLGYDQTPFSALRASFYWYMLLLIPSLLPNHPPRGASEGSSEVHALQLPENVWFWDRLAHRFAWWSCWLIGEGYLHQVSLLGMWEWEWH